MTDHLIECDAEDCVRLADYLDYNPTNHEPIHTCPEHHKVHCEGYTFRVLKKKPPVKGA